MDRERGGGRDEEEGGGRGSSFVAHTHEVTVSPRHPVRANFRSDQDYEIALGSYRACLMKHNWLMKQAEDLISKVNQNVAGYHDMLEFCFATP